MLGPRGKAPSPAAALQESTTWARVTGLSSQRDLALASWPESRAGRVALLPFYCLLLFSFLLQAEAVNLHFLPPCALVGRRSPALPAWLLMPLLRLTHTLCRSWTCGLLFPLLGLLVSLSHFSSLRGHVLTLEAVKNGK